MAVVWILIQLVLHAFGQHILQVLFKNNIRFPTVLHLNNKKIHARYADNILVLSVIVDILNLALLSLLLNLSEEFTPNVFNYRGIRFLMNCLIIELTYNIGNLAL